MFFTNYRYLFIAIFLSLVMTVSAEDNDEDRYRSFGISFSGAVGTYNSWDVDVDMEYRPIKYFGVSAGLRFTDISFGKDHIFRGETIDHSHNWKTDDLSDFSYHFAFQPQAKLYTPNIRLDNVGDNLNFSIGYGLTMPLTNRASGVVIYTPAEKGQFIPDDEKRVSNSNRVYNIYNFVNISANLESGIWGLSLGYRVSDYDVFGSARNIVVEGQKLVFDNHKFNNEVYLAIHYKL